MIKIDKLNPFGRLCITLGMLPSSYKESLTYEEQLLWMLNYIEKTLIPTINNNAQAVEELQGLYLELKSYVDSYFDNLDVQKEINNKLDKMAESGQLTDIIAQYLQLAGLLCFNTLNDLKNAENLSNGSFTKTLGKNTYKDGQGAFYKIRTLLNTDVIDNKNIIALTNFNTLIAELIPNKPKKRMLLFGDSWSIPNYPYVDDQSIVWYNKVADYLDANLTNYANSGAGFLINNNTILSQVNSAISNETKPEEVDYIFVEGGYNDLNYTDNKSYDEITGAVKNVFNTLTDTFINAKIYFLTINTPNKLLKTETGTPTYLYNTYGFYQYFLSAIINCNSSNIAVINMIPFLLGISDAVEETLHPNTIGMNILSKSIISSLKGNYTKQTLVNNINNYTATIAISGSPNITNTKNVISQDYMDVIFTLHQDTAYDRVLQYGYYLDELPTIYLPNNFSIVSYDGKYTISAQLTIENNRNKLLLTLPNNTIGYFDINLRIPLK